MWRGAICARRGTHSFLSFVQRAVSGADCGGQSLNSPELRPDSLNKHASYLGQVATQRRSMALNIVKQLEM